MAIAFLISIWRVPRNLEANELRWHYNHLYISTSRVCILILPIVMKSSGSLNMKTNSDGLWLIHIFIVFCSL